MSTVSWILADFRIKMFEKLYFHMLGVYLMIIGRVRIFSPLSVLRNVIKNDKTYYSNGYIVSV